jgi:S-DNA-T family DNA segregation ATPase FtsK/SpoIIIE
MPGRLVTIGLLDAPERQEQRPAVLDLADGGVLAFGSGGAGATTLLRTVAASLVTTAAGTGHGVAVVVFDAGGRGCAGLAALPDVEVVPVDDLEAVTRHLLVLERELDRRRAAFGDMTTGDTGCAGRDARIVVLVDDIGALIGALLDASVAADDWVARLVRVLVDGRQVGIHAIATAARRSAVPARVHAAVANRLVLRQTDEAAAADHGLPAARTRGLVPGRGLWVGPGHAEPVLVQIATVSTDPAASEQAAALADLGARLRSAPPRSRPAVLRSIRLPDRDEVPPDARSTGLAVVVGRADVTGAAAVVDLDWSHLAVSGPPRSGRSTALAAVASQLAHRDTGDGRDVVVVGPGSSPLRRLPAGPGMTAAFGRGVAPLLHRLAHPRETPWVLVLDDLDALDDPELLPTFEQLARDDSVRLVAAMEPRVGFTTNPLLTVVRRARRHLVLQPDDPAEFLQLTGTRLAVRPGLRMPPGRGVLLVDRIPTVVQVTDSLTPDGPRDCEPNCVGTATGRAAA